MGLDSVPHSTDPRHTRPPAPKSFNGRREWRARLRQPPSHSPTTYPSMPCTLFGGLACAIPACCCHVVPSCGIACPAAGCCCLPLPICDAPFCCPLPCLPAVCVASYMFWKTHEHPDDQVDTAGFENRYMPIDDTQPFRLDQSHYTYPDDTRSKVNGTVASTASRQRAVFAGDKTRH